VTARAGSRWLLYYTRFIRHDPYTVVGALALVIAIFRYIEKPERRWLVLGGAMLGFLYTNHEIVFAIAALFVAFLAGSLLLGRLRPILPIVIAAAALGLAVVLLYRATEFGGPLPEIPWDRSGQEAPMPTAENQRQFYLDLLTHPFIMSLIGVVILFFVGCWYVLRGLTLPAANERDERGSRRGWVEVLFAEAQPATIDAAFRNVWRDKVGLQIALLIAVGICATLFTTFFTNLGGLATGTIATDGTLLYWLGQQGVQRGEQPWFYFLTLAPQYEFFAIAFGLPAVVLAAWRLIKSFRGNHEWNPRLTFTLFLSFWAIGITAGLSYAGEKMPWLVVHITLPLILLAATLLDEVVTRAVAAHRAAALDPNRQPRPAWVGPALVTALLTLGGGWLAMAADFSAPSFIQDASGTWQRIVDSAAADDWWQLAIPPAVSVAFIALAWWLIGGARAGRATVVALTVGVLLLQTHAGFRLSFQEGDVARDTLIYNTTTPDITNMMGDIEELSYLMTGGLDLEVQYGDNVDWPLFWYLRDYPNAFKSNTVAVGTEVPIIVLSYAEASQYRSELTNYTDQEYVLRWHEPEDAIYRNFAIAPELPPYRSAWGEEENPHGPIAILQSILSSLNTQTTQEGQQRLWRLIMYREMPAGTINWGYSVFIRNDLLPTYNSIRYDM
jgi:predicted membrane-bound mannosyltransferase